jgi:hypothetical protein
MSPKRVVIDACATLNLLATGREVELISALDWTLVMVPDTKQEVRYLRGPPEEKGRPTRAPVDWAPLERSGRLLLQPLGSDELDAFVAAAARLTDVDAMALARAGTLRLPLFTDDGKMRRVFRELYPHLSLLSTLSLVRQASKLLRMEQAAVRAMLQNLRQRANFAPPRDDPDQEWYVSYIKI